MIIDNDKTFTFHKIDVINRSRSRVRLWNYKHKLENKYKLNKQNCDKKYYNKMKNLKLTKLYKSKLSFIQNRSQTRYKPLLKNCNLCNKEFIDRASGRNQLFCCNLHRVLFVIQQRKSFKHLFSKQEWINKCKATEGFCKKCKKFIGIDKLSLHHNPPISKAPENFIYTIKNVEPICLRCNMSIGNRC